MDGPPSTAGSRAPSVIECGGLVPSPHHAQVEMPQETCQSQQDSDAALCLDLKAISLTTGGVHGSPRAYQRLADVLVAQQKRLNVLHTSLLTRVERLTGVGDDLSTASPPSVAVPPPAAACTPTTDLNNRFTVRALLDVLPRSSAATAMAATGDSVCATSDEVASPHETLPPPTTTPVIVLDITSLYSASGASRTGCTTSTAKSQPRQRHVGIQTVPCTPTGSASPLGETNTTAPHAQAHAVPSTSAASPPSHEQDVDAETMSPEALRAALAAEQSRALFQQASLVRMSKELAKAQETIRLLTEDGDDWLERAAYQRVNVPARHGTAATASSAHVNAANTGADASEDAKDRELRRLRTLMRFSELKKDSDLLPEAYAHLDSALKEMTALRRDQTRSRVKREEARQCVRAVAGCVLELYDFLPRSRDKATNAAVRDRIAYVLERCRDVDTTIPPLPNSVQPPHDSHDINSVDSAARDSDARPQHRTRPRRHDADRSHSWQPPCRRSSSDVVAPSVCSRPRPHRTVDPSNVLPSSLACDRVPHDPVANDGDALRETPVSRRHSAASHVRVQEAVAHARRASAGHTRNGPAALPPRPRGTPSGASAAPTRLAMEEAASAFAPWQPARARSRPPTPGTHAAARPSDDSRASGKRPTVGGGTRPGLSRGSSLRSEGWVE